MSLLRSAAVFAAVVLAAADVSITFEPTDALAPAQEYHESSLLFQAVEPPTEVTCSYDDGNEEMDCGAELPLDLSDGSPTENTLKITFRAPSGHYIHIVDEERSRIEISLKVDCGIPGNNNGAQFYQSPPITSVHIKGIGSADSTVRDKVDMESSFVDLGKCDGCGDCEIFSRIELTGPLDDKITEVSWEVQYDKSLVVPGEQTYFMHSDGYMWIRSAIWERLEDEFAKKIII